MGHGIYVIDQPKLLVYNNLQYNKLDCHLISCKNNGNKWESGACLLKKKIILLLYYFATGKVWRSIGIPEGSWCTILECICSSWTVEPSWANVPSHPIQGYRCSCLTDAIPSSPADTVWRYQAFACARFSRVTRDAFIFSFQSCSIAVGAIWTRIFIRPFTTNWTEVTRGTHPTIRYV